LRQYAVVIVTNSLFCKHFHNVA